MTGTAIIQRMDADFAKQALSEVSRRLVLRGEDSAAARLSRVIEALDAETIHVGDGIGRA